MIRLIIADPGSSATLPRGTHCEGVPHSATELPKKSSASVFDALR
jgi:hypothetical protein